MRVVTFNLHAGVDGWGRPTPVLDVVRDLNADLYVLPELWRGDDGPDLFDELRTSMHLEGAFAPLAHGYRVVTGTGGEGWQPRAGHLTGERGLYFSEHRPLGPAQRESLAAAHHPEAGTWGLGLLTHDTVEDVSIVELGRLPRERVRRALVVMRLRRGEQRFYALAMHGAHLSHGSFLHYRRVARHVAALEPRLPLLFGGDFNCWRPLLRVALPGWRTLARGRTWPTPRPHSQIDHLLGRGPWRTLASFTRDGGSDHLALVADVELD